jgi:hypothetical protein
VRFYLQPNIQNALAWVQKYNDMMNRSRQLAAAWSQAQQIYDTFQKQGKPLPKDLQPEFPTQQLPPVKSFGVALPQELQGIFKTPAGTGKPPLANVGGVNGADSGVDMGINSNISLPDDTEAVTADGHIPNNAPAITTTATGPANATAPRVPGQIELSYYFSAECPFCKKFLTGFREDVTKLGDKVHVTCVDMTPTGQTVKDIEGQLECDWRPLMPGEKANYGIVATPTLIIDRGNNAPLERISGYVDKDKLLTLIEKGPKGLKTPIGNGGETPVSSGGASPG